MSSELDTDRLAVLIHEVRSPVAALSAIAETVSDGGLDTVTRQELVRLVMLACRGMERIVGDVAVASVRLEEVDRDPVGVATDYLVEDGPVESRRTNVFSVTARGMPDGGMVTTAGDLGRFVGALSAGALLGPDLLARMQTPHAPPDAEGGLYGYGCLLTRRP